MTVMNMQVYILCAMSFMVSYQLAPKDPVKIPEVETYHLSSVEVKSELLSPARMVIADGRLVVYERKVKDPFKVFNIPIDGKATSYLSRGRGPQEVIDPDVKSFIPVERGFQVVDLDRTMKKLSFDSGKLTIIDSKPIPGLTGTLNGVLPFGDGYISQSPRFDGYYYSSPDKGTSTLLCKNPKWKDRVDDSKNVLFGYSSAAVHSGKKRFAVFFMFHDKVIYYNEEGKIIKEIQIPLKGVSGTKWGDSRVFYTDVVAFNDKVIVANYGNKEYHFFDWEGNFLKRIEFDHKLSVATIDFSSWTFYGLGYSDGSIRLYSASVRPVLD